MSAPRWIRRASRLTAFGAAVVLCSGMSVVAAQHVGHSKMRVPPTVPPDSGRAAETPPATMPAGASKRAAPDPHAGHLMPGTTPPPASAASTARKPGSDAVPVDHAAMGHAPAHSAPASETMDHAAMGHAAPGSTTTPREPIPALTDADRAAAFPDVAGHGAHDKAIHSYWLVDRLELVDPDEGAEVAWEALGWIGTDLDRLWIRSEGERSDGSVESADVEVLYGRNVSRWWDAVVGVRQDIGEGPSQTFAAFGVMGLSPYKFEVEATAYIGQSGQTALRLEAEYDTLLTNRLILQWQAEAELHGRNDDRRGIGSGLSTFEAGLRLRYEVTRQFAPYIGVTWERAFGNTADFRRADGVGVDDTRIVAGVRVWF